jgi:outer membrane protein
MMKSQLIFFSAIKKRYPPWAAAALLGLSLLRPAGVCAQEKSPEKLVLDLPRMIAMVLARSPEVAESVGETASARSDLDKVHGAYFPQLEVTAVTGPVNDAKDPVIVGNQIHDPSPGTSLENTGIFGRLDFTLTQPLYSFGKLSNREKAAQRGVRANELGIEKKKNEVALRVKELYYALVLAREGMQAADEAGDFFEDARKRISRLLDLGSPNVTESDLYRIDAYQADTLRSRAEAQKGRNVAYFALKSLLGLSQGQDFEPVDKTLEINAGKMAAMASYITRALKERPELKQLEEALEAQKYQVMAARSDRYPTFFAAVEGSFAGAPGREHFENAYIEDQFNHAYAGIVAGLKWNWDFGISRSQVEKMDAEYNTLVSTRQNAAVNIPIQVAKSYQELIEYEKSADAYHEATVASRKWVISAMADFDMGVGTASDMLTGIEKYGHNQGRYIEALFNYNLSLAELEYAAGIQTWHPGYNE